MLRTGASRPASLMVSPKPAFTKDHRPEDPVVSYGSGQTHHDDGQLDPGSAAREHGARMIEFTLTRTSTASIETVFDAMTDHRGIAAACGHAVAAPSIAREPLHQTVSARSDAWWRSDPHSSRRSSTTSYPPATRPRCSQAHRPESHRHDRAARSRPGTEVSWHLRSTLKIPGVDRLMLPVFKKVIDELLKGGIAAA